MTFDWTPLRKELGLWRTAGFSPALWWRDDDAIRPTPALDRLQTLASRLGLPVHLAVIPAHAETTLAHQIATGQHLVPVVHGWAHQNHAPKTEKKSEFGHMREGAEHDLRAGLGKMQQLFRQRFLPLFVPPWNRLHPEYVPVLKRLGYIGVSGFGPVPEGGALPFINTHVDPVAWRSHRSLSDPDRLIAVASEALAARRKGETSIADPVGYLSHHLVHDEPIWSFTAQFLAEMLDGGARALRLADTFGGTHEPA